MNCIQNRSQGKDTSSISLEFGCIKSAYKTAASLLKLHEVPIPVIELL
jgi:hypothetical protein